MTRKTKFWIAPALLAGTLIAGTAQADSSYIKPSSTSFAGENNTVTFDAAGADHLFFLDHRPIALATIKVVKPDGTPGAPINTFQQRFRSVFDLKLDQQGTWRIASEQVMVIGTFMLDGQQRRVGGRGGPPPSGQGGQGQGGQGAGVQQSPGVPARLPPVAVQDIPANATDIHLTEVSSKTETFVTAGAPTPIKPSGKGLELDPITHPNAVVMGEPAQFRYLVDGQAAVGVKITVIADGDRYREQAGARTLTTGKDGLVTITWPTAGLYWVGAETEDRNATEKRAETRRMTYAATLEVMTP